MGKETKIGWTDASFNPWIGCQKVSPGCAHCLHPDSRIMMADTSWRRISDLSVGDDVYGFDDEGNIGRNRLMRRSTVMRVWRTIAPTVRIETEAGRRIICSHDHRFLYRTTNRGSQWIEARDLKLATPLLVLGNPDGAADTLSLDYRAGYVAGATAGDGTMRFDPSWRSDKLGFPAMYWRIAEPEFDAPLLERIVAYLGAFGISATIKPFNSNCEGGFKLKGDKKPQSMAKVECRSKADLLVIDGLLIERDSLAWKAGWLAGFLDTDGCASGSERSNGVLHRWSQVYSRNDYLDRTVRYLADIGLDGEIEHYKGKASSVRLIVKDTGERVEAISRMGPVLHRKGIGRLYGNKDGQRASRHPGYVDPVVSLAFGPETELIDITTSTGTFVAEGFSTHNCYAKTLMDDRFHRVTWGPAPEGTRARTSAKNWSDVAKWDDEARETGRPLKVFCASLSDWLEDRADLVEVRRDLLALIGQTTSLTWLMLSKRLHLAPRLVRDVAGMEIDEWLVRNPHVWMGTSIENQKWANERMQWLVSLPATVLFLSIEPMLGPIDLRQVRLPDGDTLGRGLFSHATGHGVGWAIVGAESGKGARPMQDDWVRNLRDQCVEAGVPFFYKQQMVNGEIVHAPELDGRQWQEFPVLP